jgi:hypothetical protein
MDNIRPMCIHCSRKPGRSAGVSRDGVQRWRNICSSCDNNRYRKARSVSLTCTQCGFVASDACQIDTVDHKSWCSNCNRLRIKMIKRQQLEQYELTVDATVSWDDIKL